MPPQAFQTRGGACHHLPARFTIGRNCAYTVSCSRGQVESSVQHLVERSGRASMSSRVGASRHETGPDLRQQIGAHSVGNERSAMQEGARWVSLPPQSVWVEARSRIGPSAEIQGARGDATDLVAPCHVLRSEPSPSRDHGDTGGLARPRVPDHPFQPPNTNRPCSKNNHGARTSSGLAFPRTRSCSSRQDLAAPFIE